jgi:hypothetical protein
MMRKIAFFALFSLITCATFAQGGASKKKETAQVSMQVKV